MTVLLSCLKLFTDTHRLNPTVVAVVAEPIRERLTEVAAERVDAIVLFTRPNMEGRTGEAQR